MIKGARVLLARGLGVGLCLKGLRMRGLEAMLPIQIALRQLEDKPRMLVPAPNLQTRRSPEHQALKGRQPKLGVFQWTKRLLL